MDALEGESLSRLPLLPHALILLTSLTCLTPHPFPAFEVETRLHRPHAPEVHRRRGRRRPAADDDALSGLAGGCCFDFSRLNDHLFLVGTEEGRIHKCSRAYQSQYLETYEGHYMAVYSVRWNNFNPKLFLSRDPIFSHPTSPISGALEQLQPEALPLVLRRLDRQDVGAP